MPPFLFANELEQYQGVTFRVDSGNGNDASDGSNWTFLAMNTVNATIARTVNGRGDRVYIAGLVTQPIVLDKSGVALVFMPGSSVDPGAGNTGILVTSGCLIYAPVVTNGRIGIHLNGVSNVTVKRAVVSGMEPNGGDAIAYFLDSSVTNFNNALVECMVIGDGDEYGFILNDEGLFHHLDYCIATGCLSGVKCLAGASGIGHRINRFGFAANTTQVEQVDAAHAYELMECYWSDNADTTGDGFGDTIPFPSSGFKESGRDKYPIGSIAGWMATMMTRSDDIHRILGLSGIRGLGGVGRVLP